MKKSLVFAVVAIISLLVIAGIAMAQGAWRGNNKKDSKQWTGMMHGNMMAYHEDMEELMEKGNYNDLAALREKLGFKIMPWVGNEDDFKQAQKIHETHENQRFSGRRKSVGFFSEMVKFHEENGFRTGGFGGCPMMG